MKTKYFKVLVDTPLWNKGAIISNEQDKDEYYSIMDIWDTVELKHEYLSAHIIEKLPKFFQEVEPGVGKGGELTFAPIKKPKKKK